MNGESHCHQQILCHAQSILCFFLTSNFFVVIILEETWWDSWILTFKMSLRAFQPNSSLLSLSYCRSPRNHFYYGAGDEGVHHLMCAGATHPPYVLCSCKDASPSSSSSSSSNSWTTVQQMALSVTNKLNTIFISLILTDGGRGPSSQLQLPISTPCTPTVKEISR